MKREEGRMGVAGGEVIVTALTHRGAVRSANEDAVVMGALTVAGANMTSPVRCILPISEPVILAVADGIGGQAAGELASEHSVHRLAETWQHLAVSKYRALLFSYNVQWC